MKQYLDFIAPCARAWHRKEPTAPAPARARCSATEMRFDLREGFPVVTTQEAAHDEVDHSRTAVVRKARPTSGTSKDNGVSIWDEWADENGELGPVYGSQWRAWPTPDGRHIDQISELVAQIRSNPDSRRLIVSAPGTVGEIHRR
ncbi:thymidylate synthase [Cupriavidus basilensis]